MSDNCTPHVIDTLPVHVSLQLNPPHSSIADNIIFLNEGYNIPLLDEITVEGFINKIADKFKKTYNYAILADSKTIGVLILVVSHNYQVSAFIYLHTDYRGMGISDVLIQSLLMAAKNKKMDLFFELEDSNLSAVKTYSRIIPNVEPEHIKSQNVYIWFIKPEHDVLCLSSNKWLMEEFIWVLQKIIDSKYEL